MVKVMENEFNEKQFYTNQGKEFVDRIASIKDEKTLEALGRMVHDLPKNMNTFKRDKLVATHRDHEVFSKLIVDINFIMRKVGAKE